MCVSLVLCDKSELETSAQFDTVPTSWGLSLHLNNSSRSSKQPATGRDPEPVQNISYWIITGNQAEIEDSTPKSEPKLLTVQGQLHYYTLPTISIQFVFLIDEPNRFPEIYFCCA